MDIQGNVIGKRVSEDDGKLFSAEGKLRRSRRFRNGGDWAVQLSGYTKNYSTHLRPIKIPYIDVANDNLETAEHRNL